MSNVINFPDRNSKSSQQLPSTNSNLHGVQMNTIKELNEKLSDLSSRGLLTITKRDLARISGRERLGGSALDEVSTKLRKHGIGHYPENLKVHFGPNSSYKTVRLYLIGSDAEKIIKNALTDDELRHLVGWLPPNYGIPTTPYLS